MITMKGVMTMATAHDVLKVAASEIGNCESPKNSNKTTYGREFGLNGQPWCAIFLWWCFKHAGAGSLFPHNASAAYAQDEMVRCNGGAWIMKKNKSRTTRKAYLSKAKPGDIVCFDFGKMNAYRQHIGIVESVSGDYLICIEGNTSKSGSQSNGGMVVRQRRIYTSVCSAARPNWDGKSVPELKPDPYAPLEVDGDFGFYTKTKLQVWVGVTPDGDIGKVTVRALQKKVGTKVDGEWGNLTTKAIQKLLNKHGNKLKVDGEFGRKTITALQKYLNDVVHK